jgi:glucose/arabinose dehydrogenase
MRFWFRSSSCARAAAASRGFILIRCAAVATMLAAAATCSAQSPTTNLAEPPPDLKTDPMPLRVVEAYPNLRIERPIVITGAGDESGRLFIASQYGQIYWIDQNDHDVEQPQLFMDMSDQVVYKDHENEEGFLGLAFHPQFKQNGHFYVYYTSTKAPRLSVISRFTAAGDDRSTADVGTEVELMQIEQPFWNHNGGTVIFGPDGYLYVGLGDGGKANDPLKSGQDLSQLLGSILRIDVDHRSQDSAYGIPQDNPFVNRPGARPEIYAYGVRNIWRMSFDPATNDFWAADVGQNDWEEVNLIEKGGNYGWSLREGAHPFTLGGGPGSDYHPDLIDPIVEYPHTDAWGKSVTGGAVYRGKRTPMLNGYYLYGDYISGRLWALKYDPEAKRVLENREIAWQNLPVFTFGQTDDGEVLMSTMSAGGRIYRFEANGE